MDREAFNERFAILLAEELQHEHEIEQYRLQYLRFLAEQDAYNTLFARLATAAIRGDWTPAQEQCRRERELHGEAWARELMRSIQAAVREKRLWMK